MAIPIRTLEVIAESIAKETGGFIHSPIPGPNFVSQIEGYVNSPELIFYNGFNSFGKKNLRLWPEYRYKATGRILHRILGKEDRDRYSLPVQVRDLYNQRGFLRFVRQPYNQTGRLDYWRVLDIKGLENLRADDLGNSRQRGESGAETEGYDTIVIDPVQRQVVDGKVARSVRRIKYKRHGIFGKKPCFEDNIEEVDNLNLEGIPSRDYLERTSRPGEPVWNVMYMGLVKTPFDSRPGSYIRLEFFMPETEAGRFADIAEEDPSITFALYKSMFPGYALHPFTAVNPKNQLLLVRDYPNNLSDRPRSLEKRAAIKKYEPILF